MNTPSTFIWPQRRGFSSLFAGALALLLSVASTAPVFSGEAFAATRTQTAGGAQAGTTGKTGRQITPAIDVLALVQRKAEEVAARSYDKNRGAAPDFLLNLSAEQWQNIRFRRRNSIWRNSGLPYEIRLEHPGFIYNRAVAINIVENGTVKPLVFDPAMYVYENAQIEEKVRAASPGFAGFSLHLADNKSDAGEVKLPLTTFLGASYFKSRGRHSHYGLYARGLAINTASPDGEEFPYFREFWLARPEPDATSITVYALMDSPSMTGAFQFVIAPGISSIMDVSCTLYLRKGSSLPQKTGLAPLTSMFLYSETHNGTPDDYRPEVHNSDGLLLQSRDNIWSWAPLANPSRLAVTAFPLENPKGFGLMQRDDSFDHYQDITTRFERRPSLWIEPVGDWGKGHVELIAIPTKEEIHDNIVAFWVPEKTFTAPGGKNTGNSMSFAYRLYWMTPGVTPHTLGRAVSTRTFRPQSDTVRFIVDFEGEELNSLPADTGLTSIVESQGDTPIFDKKLEKNPATQGWRLSFSTRPPTKDGVVQSILSAREGPPRIQFKAFLKKGENIPAPLTETWVYEMPF